MFIQGHFVDQIQWIELAKATDRSGFDCLRVADHLGSSATPFAALGAAVAVTDRVRLGACVLNAGLREPLTLAAELATLDALSGGRAVFGVGEPPGGLVLIEQPEVMMVAKCVDRETPAVGPARPRQLEPPAPGRMPLDRADAH
ncbi:MAG: LLM class flavin-dependent oxidoreductase [Acidimicrobiales bacterium]